MRAFIQMRLNRVVPKLCQFTIRGWASWRLRRLLDLDSLELLRLGTAHGGWNVPRAAVQAGGTAVCVGIGEDMSFDVELNKRGMKVYSLDPTPRSTAHAQKILESVRTGQRVAINGSSHDYYDLSGFDPVRLRHLDVGLWSENISMRFFAPKDPEHVSHSIVNLQGTKDYFEAECLTLRTACGRLGISEIDILKLDVEGAEYAIVSDILRHGPRPRTLCFEFDELRTRLDGGYFGRIRTTIQTLKASGYRFAHIEASNALFLDASAATRPIAEICATDYQPVS